MRAYDFRPATWSVLLVLLLAGGMVMAGVWQYDRGRQKQALQAQRSQLGSRLPEPLIADLATPPAGEVRAVFVEGRYDDALTVRLDNQPHRQQPGVHVWTPLVLANGQRLIVDRGWLPLNASLTPAPEGPQRLEGSWRSPPRAGLQLGETASACKLPRPELVTYPDVAERRCLFGERTVDGLLELSPDAPGGFLRDWAAAGIHEIPPARHFGYALQWWLFAATLLALFIKINLKKKPATHD